MSKSVDSYFSFFSSAVVAVLEGRRAVCHPITSSTQPYSDNSDFCERYLLHNWYKDMTRLFTLDIYISMQPGQDILVEQWSFRLDPGSKVYVKSDIVVEKRLKTFVRAIKCFVRLLPSFNLLNVRCMLRFKISVLGTNSSNATFGDYSHHSGPPPISRYRFHENKTPLITTPRGQILVEVFHVNSSVMKEILRSTQPGVSTSSRDVNPTAAIPIPSSRSVSFSRNRDSSGDSQANGSTSNPSSYQTRTYLDMFDGGNVTASSRSSDATGSYIGAAVAAAAAASFEEYAIATSNTNTASTPTNASVTSRPPSYRAAAPGMSFGSNTSGHSSASNNGKISDVAASGKTYDAVGGNSVETYRQRTYSKDYDQQFAGGNAGFPPTRGTPPSNSGTGGQHQQYSSRSFENRTTNLTAAVGSTASSSSGSSAIMVVPGVTGDSQQQQQYLLMFDQRSTPPAAGTSFSYSFQSTPPFALKHALQDGAYYDPSGALVVSSSSGAGGVVGASHQRASPPSSMVAAMHPTLLSTSPAYTLSILEAAAAAMSLQQQQQQDYDSRSRTNSADRRPSLTKSNSPRYAISNPSGNSPSAGVTNGLTNAVSDSVASSHGGGSLGNGGAALLEAAAAVTRQGRGLASSFNGGGGGGGGGGGATLVNSVSDHHRHTGGGGIITGSTLRSSSHMWASQFYNKTKLILPPSPFNSSMNISLSQLTPEQQRSRSNSVADSAPARTSSNGGADNNAPVRNGIDAASSNAPTFTRNEFPAFHFSSNQANDTGGADDADDDGFDNGAFAVQSERQYSSDSTPSFSVPFGTVESYQQALSQHTIDQVEFDLDEGDDDDDTMPFVMAESDIARLQNARPQLLNEMQHQMHMENQQHYQQRQPSQIVGIAALYNQLQSSIEQFKTEKSPF